MESLDEGTNFWEEVAAYDSSSDTKQAGSIKGNVKRKIFPGDGGVSLFSAFSPPAMLRRAPSFLPGAAQRSARQRVRPARSR